jgi:hypothetical protein
MDKKQDPGSGIQHSGSATHCLELELGSAEVLRHGEHVGQNLVREAHQPTVLDIRRLVLSTQNPLLLTFWSGSGSADLYPLTNGSDSLSSMILMMHKKIYLFLYFFF